MKRAYFEVCNDNLKSGSNDYRKLEILASELFSISCYGDYILKQAFVQTATGECLDRLGEVRSCKRKTASYSSGSLTFCLNEAISTNVDIPKNTICSVKGKPYIQFITLSPVTITAGSTSATVSAKSFSTGGQYNVDAGMVNVMVNAPVGVSYVTNNSPFTGGYDLESDASYRQRILRQYTIPSNGVNCTTVENAVLQLDYVIDCNVPLSSSVGEINIYVATKTGSLTSQQIIEIKNQIALYDTIGCNLNISVAKAYNYKLTVNVNVKNGFDSESIKNEIESRLNKSLNYCKINDNLPLCTVAKLIIDIDGISKLDILGDNVIGDVLYCPSDKYLSMTELVVNCFGE